MKKIIGIFLALSFAGIAGVAVYIISVANRLPKLISVQDYQPLLVSEVYARGGEKIGEFYRENRKIVSFNEMPPLLVKAFIAAEDSTFFEHGGIDFMAIFRASLANLRAGKMAQGGSTITQQVAKSLLLSSEKTLIRKIKEAILAYKMEKNLSKEDILYLYLNQIFFGQNAYGVASAAETFFHKPVKDLEVHEMALLAGLPKAPSGYNPVRFPEKAKHRQRYVLTRMAEIGAITEKQAEEAKQKPIIVYVRKENDVAPFFVETIRQMLVEKLGESMVLDKGLKIYTGLEYTSQKAAQESLRTGLRELDKRQGWRGAKENLGSPEEVAVFLLKIRNMLMDEAVGHLVIYPDGSFGNKGPLNLTDKNEKGQARPNLPDFIKLNQIVKAVVTKVDDDWGLTQVRFAESKGLIDLASMKWARKPDPSVRAEYIEVKKPSEALKVGDVIEIKIVGEKFRSERIDDLIKETKTKKKNKKPLNTKDLPNFDAYAQVELEQRPLVNGGLLSFDQKTSDIIAMVGGTDFDESKLNRTFQAVRQTGSAFKPIVYAAALDHGYTPSTKLIDSPLVYEEKVPLEEVRGQNKQAKSRGGKPLKEETRIWKPDNHSKTFEGDVLFRNALARSLNVPTVKILEKIGVDWIMDYARRLGVFSPLNPDFTLALGSSSLNLYEITKVFSEFGRLGVRVRPILVQKVQDRTGKVLVENISLEEKFQKNTEEIEKTYEERRLAFLEEHPEGNYDPFNPTKSGAETAATDPKAPAEQKPVNKKVIPPIFFNDPEQLIRPTTAYLTTSLLEAVIEDREGTGGAARALGRPAAGKTGTTSDYIDAWFLGYTAQIASGVWVGFDEEKFLGQGEVGGRSALPIWLEYMKVAHAKLPVESFPVPPGIVFVNIDRETGDLASPSSKEVIRQAYLENTEPKVTREESRAKDETEFYREDYTE